MKFNLDVFAVYPKRELMIRVLMKTTALFIAGLLAATSANAQIGGDWFPDEFLPSGIFTIDAERDETYIDLGATVIHRPAYLGSSKQDTNLFPFVNAEYRGRWFLNPYQGVGFNPINNKNLRISTGIGFVSGRKAEDTPFNDEVFDLDPGAGLIINGRYIFKYGAVELTVSESLTGDVEGLQLSGRLATLIPVSKQLRIVPAVSVSWQGTDRRNSIYGINAEQSAVSRTGIVSYDSDFTNVGVALEAYWSNEDRSWHILGLVQHRELVGDIRGSILTPEDSGLLAVVGFARRY